MFAASKSGKATAVAPVTPDTYFPYVTFLSETTGTNGQQNNTFLDSSSNNFSITRAGTPTQGSVNPYWPDGYWSNYFNGSGSYLNVAYNSAFDFGSGSFTIEFWVNTVSTTVYQCGVRLGDGGSGNWIVYVNDSSGNGNVGFFSIGLGFSITASGALVNNGLWNHVAVVRSGSVFTVYINGVSRATTTNAGSLGAISEKLWIARDAANIRDYTGFISNVRLVKNQALASGNFTPPTAPVTNSTVGWTGANAATSLTGTVSLLTCQGNRFKDNSTNNFAVTPTGLPSTIASQPFSAPASYTTAAYGGSGVYNGSTDYLSVADNAALQLGSGDFTIEGWFYISAALSTAYNLISKGAAATGWSLNTTTSARIQFSYTALNLTGATTTLAPNSWYHIAVVRSGTSIGNLKIYINGVQEVASAAAVLDNFNQTDLLYVSASRTAAVLLNGYSSNVRVVKGTAVYTAAFTPPTSPVTAITNTSLLINSTNAGVYTAAVLSNLATSGNAQASTSIYKWSPSSIKFDGGASTCVVINDVLNGPTDLNTGTSTNAWTIECWFYYTAAGYVVSKGGNPGSTTPSYILSVGSGTGTFTVASVSGGTGYTITYAASSMPTSTWIYWAATRTSAGVITTYINGVSQGSSGSGIIIYNNNNYYFSLGATFTGYGIGNPLTGYIQDFRITKGIARTITTPTSAFPTS
jgi:hypothetical protein